MNEDKERVELNSLVKGKSISSDSSAKTPFWKEVVCFITGDITDKEMTAILNREKEIYDHNKTREIPANIKKTSK